MWRSPAPRLPYQWQKNGTNLVDGGNLSGSTNRTLSLANVSLADAGTYSVIVSNALGSVTSAAAHLTVVYPPVFLSAVRTNCTLTLTWSAAVGQKYRLQYKPSLAATNWSSWAVPSCDRQRRYGFRQHLHQRAEGSIASCSSRRFSSQRRCFSAGPTDQTIQARPMSPAPSTSACRPAARLAVAPAYKWWVVLMLWFVCFFNYADRQSIFSVFPKLKEEFGFDEVELGLIGSAFMWVYAAGAPCAGFICDRLRRKDLILGGCVFWSVITVMTGWCGKLWQFVTVRALEGLGETFYFPAGMSLLSDYHGRRTRSRALSFHQSSVYVGTILGSWLGAWFAERLGWRLGFYFFGGLGLILALALQVLRNRPGGKPTPREPNSLGLFHVVSPPRRGPPLLLGRRAAGPRRPRPAGSPVRQTCRVLFRTPTVPLLMAAFLAANFVAAIFLTWTQPSWWRSSDSS